LRAVREHNLRAFRQAWKRFEEAVPGSVRLVPQSRLRAEIERDYEAMQGMILGDVPDFGWIIEQLQYAESSINRNCG
ncbi:MAG: nucleotidyl transferase AbiEii/AbiGii toxin family protein, partial [Gammaproteobacteria bacterium]|nr:nucleotidyl transferase AbiEii/AbiGii toxin family protein [Gammaproteobacteria bacterium]